MSRTASGLQLCPHPISLSEHISSASSCRAPGVFPGQRFCGWEFGKPFSCSSRSLSNYHMGLKIYLFDPCLSLVENLIILISNKSDYKATGEGQPSNCQFTRRIQQINSSFRDWNNNFICYTASALMLGISDIKNIQACDAVAFQSEPARLVNIYLRQTNKFGRKVQTPQKMPASQLAIIIESNLQIPKQKQIFFVASVQYSHADERAVDLHENDIVHVHSIESCSRPLIRIFLQEIKEPNQISKPLALQVNAQQNIKACLLANFDTSDMNLIESGRKLDLEKTFQELSVCNQSTIYYRFCKQELNHEEFEKDFNKLFDQDEESQKTNKTPSKINDRKIKEKVEASGVKIAETEIKVDQIGKPNFKKKKIAYQQAIKSSKSQNYIEQKDLSNSNNKEKPILALKGKKHSLNESKQQVEIRSSMSLNAKIKLRQELRKLFQADALPTEDDSESKRTGAVKNEHEIYDQLNAQAVF